MKKRKTNSIFLLLSLFLFIYPTFAYADAGLPMIALTFPAMIAALIPIILIEAVIFSRYLKIKYESTLLPSLSANAASTIIGFPLSWFILFGLELLAARGGTAFDISTFAGKVIAVTLQAAWIVPYENELWWMLPIAAAVGLIPAYFISIFIELHIVRKFFRDRNKNDLKQVVVKANLVTYGFLIILYFITFAYLFAVHHRWITLTPEDKTIVEASESIKANPNDYLAYYRRGLAYAKLNSPESAKAISDFNKAIAINSTVPLLYIARGNFYRDGYYHHFGDDGDWEQALLNYNQALKIDPNSSSAYANRGKSYIRWNKGYDQAAADLNKAIELDPDNAEAYFHLGDIAVEKKDFNQAISHYGETITLEPSNFRAYAKRGMAHIKQGDFDQAINDFDKAIELQPQNGDLYMLRAGAYYDKKKFQKSWNDVKKAKSLGTDPLAIHLQIDYGLKNDEFVENLKSSFR